MDEYLQLLQSANVYLNTEVEAPLSLVSPGPVLPFKVGRAAGIEKSVILYYTDCISI